MTVTASNGQSLGCGPGEQLSCYSHILYPNEAAIETGAPSVLHIHTYLVCIYIIHTQGSSPRVGCPSLICLTFSPTCPIPTMDALLEAAAIYEKEERLFRAKCPDPFSNERKQFHEHIRARDMMRE